MGLFKDLIVIKLLVEYDFIRYFSYIEAALGTSMLSVEMKHYLTLWSS